MKRRLMIIGIVIICILGGILFTLNILLGLSIKQNIKLAQQKYPGTAEEALISYMMDENISAEGRTHEAIWTLGKIRSEKAFPYLKELYRNDPKGKICFGKHDEMICQYEIHKAIVAIEKGGLISYARLNK